MQYYMGKNVNIFCNTVKKINGEIYCGLGYKNDDSSQIDLSVELNSNQNFNWVKISDYVSKIWPVISKDDSRKLPYWSPNL